MKLTLKSAWGIISLAVSLTVGLSGCGSSSSGDNKTPETYTVSGVVTDPAIIGASVRLDDITGTALASVQTTNKQGEFSFTLKNQPATVLLSAAGGQDIATGLDFTGLKLKAVSIDQQSIIVSPLTTLVVAEMNDNGADYPAALTTIAQRFGLTETQVTTNPTDDAKVQKTALQLSMLATALRADGGFELVESLTEEDGVNWANIAVAVDQMDDEISEAAQQRISQLSAELQAVSNIDSSLSAAATLDEANRLSVIAGVTSFLKNSLKFEAADATQQNNVKTLAEALWNANEKRGLSSDGVQFANLIRYVFNRAGMTTDDLADANFSLEADVLANIDAIASLNVINHQIPLATGELLTTSEAKRNYFYASDLSPAYQALQLFNGVTDDNAVDPTFSKIAGAYALRGMNDEADVILNSQIANPYYVIEANTRVGINKRLADDLAGAQVHWQTAKTLLDSYIDELGIENLGSDELSLISYLADNAYGEAGMTAEADSVLAHVSEYIGLHAGQPYTTAYGRLSTTLFNQAEALVAEAESAGLSAASVARATRGVSLFKQLVDGMGYQTTSSALCGGVPTQYHAVKTLRYADLADLYSRLQMATETRAAIDSFVALRADNDCTKVRTEFFVSYLPAAYGFLNDIDSFVTMANDTIRPGFMLNRSLAAAAIYQAMDLAKTPNTGDSDNVAAAIAKIVELYPDNEDVDDLEDRVEYLTNLGVNEGTPFLALRLFNDGYTTEGTQVLDTAWDIVTSDIYINGQADDGDQLMSRGCSKVARMTYQNADQALGQTRMNECATIASNFETTGSTEAVSQAYNRLSKDALLIGQKELGRNAYEKAIEFAAMLEGIDRVNATHFALLFPLEAGLLASGIDTSAITSPLSELDAIFNSAKAAASTQEEIKAAANQGLSILGAYARVTQGMRDAATTNGPLANHASVVNQLQAKASAVLMDVLALTQQLTDADDRESIFNPIFSSGQTYFIENIGIYATQAQVIDAMVGIESKSLVDYYRARLVSFILSANAFKGSAVAGIDLDNDGLPDFFEATATEAEITASGLTEDNDVDSDGINDNTDVTPFYSAD